MLHFKENQNITYFFLLLFLFRLQGASKVVFYHNRSISKALIDLFPDVGLEEAKFWTPNCKCLS